jgi:hypothetical protein|tara:strand:+ start:112 stop:309 length:198 start_codon:yes stop_codon:yes gene_type:complete
MLEVTKKILKEVSFDRQLFQKELSKSLRWMTSKEELKRLQEWCISEFGNVYPLIIRNTFAQSALQ